MTGVQTCALPICVKLRGRTVEEIHCIPASWVDEFLTDYRSRLTDEHRHWLDAVLAKSLCPQPGKRQEVISEFAYDLQHPSAQFNKQARIPVIERDPVLFWKALSLLLGLSSFILLLLRARGI